MPGYCTPDEVRKVLQETDLSGATNEPMVTASITAVSQWLRQRAGVHVYDSTGTTVAVPETPATARQQRYDIPASPHAQDRQLFHHDAARYPVTEAGRYSRVWLAHHGVHSITSLGVRQRDGSVRDWVAETEYTEGRGEDWYLMVDSEDGRSQLYLNAASIGPRVDYTELLTLEYEFGFDIAERDVTAIRRGVAHLAAAEVLEDDGVIAQIPENARLPSIDSEYDHLVTRARQYLGPYLHIPIA